MGGGYSPTSACIGHALPRQEFTSSMQQVPSWVLGPDSEPCRSPGGAVVAVRGGVAALAHRAPLSPQAGCPSTTLLSPREALDGRAPPVWGWCLLGLWEGGWEMLCLHPPGSGAGCCNITCSFGPKRGTELTTNNVQLLNVFCQKERKIKPCCKELLQAWSHWHSPVLVGPWGLWVTPWTPEKVPMAGRGGTQAVLALPSPGMGHSATPGRVGGCEERGREDI